MSWWREGWRGEGEQGEVWWTGCRRGRGKGTLRFCSPRRVWVSKGTSSLPRFQSLRDRHCSCLIAPTGGRICVGRAIPLGASSARQLWGFARKLLQQPQHLLPVHRVGIVWLEAAEEVDLLQPCEVSQEPGRESAGSLLAPGIAVWAGGERPLRCSAMPCIPRRWC